MIGITTRTNLFASLATVLFALTFLAAPSAGAGASICIYPPTGTGAPAPPAAGSAPGPWGTTYASPSPCATNMEFSNTSPSCLGPAPHTGEFCGPVTTFGTSPTTGFMWTCTAYPNLTVTLTGLVVAWDVSGPTGVPDGVVDGLDEMITGPAEGSIQLLPGPNGEYTSFVYPPPMPATYAQLIAFPIAASIVPSVYLLPIQVGCI